MDEFIIGYDERQVDARIMPVQFLLKHVESVRSVDRYVWPSLWEGVSFVPVAKAHPESVTVAITYVDEVEKMENQRKAQEDRLYWRGIADGCKPQRLPATSVCLGYDVCDRTLISGLLNCAYYQNEQVAYVERWAGKLNSVHLFVDPWDALAFSWETSRRVCEHAPFFVFGLYQYG